MFSRGNPALNEDTFDQFGMTYDANGALVQNPENTMTMSGTVWKTMLLLVAVVAAGSFTWNMAMTGSGNPMPWVLGGGVGGFIVALVTVFKPAWSPFTAPVYAALKGLMLGALSAVYEAQYGAGADTSLAFDGLVIQAIGLTLGVAAAMLILYATRIIKMTEKLRAGIYIAWGGAALFYLVAFGLSFVGVQIPMIHSSGPVGIIFSVVMITIAAFTLLVDFDLIERGSKAGAPKYMEWYGAFGLVVSLVWLYIEILRLLAKLQSRD